MIDAYEVGIQLLLQEDVSAGLTVISHELAEVDRAIAATSANLAGLVREAERGTKAVAAAASHRATVPDANERKSEAFAEPVNHDAAKQELPLTPVVKPGERAVAPSAATAEPDVIAKPSSTHPINERIEPASESHAPADSSSAPVRKTGDQNGPSDRDADTGRTEPDAPISAAVAPIARPAENAQSARSNEIAAGGQQPRGTATPRAISIPLTASVIRERRSSTNGAPLERAQSVTSGVPVRRERSVAPWSGVDQFGGQAASVRLHERASAPQSAGRSQAEPSGGTVMLDGRLVGQWLSEHMGREASRPPAGTSFFDPRQTPAWNVSGAL